MPDVPSRGLVVVKRRSNNSRHPTNQEAESGTIIVNTSPLKRYSTLTTTTTSTTAANDIIQTTIMNSTNATLTNNNGNTATTAVKTDSQIQGCYPSRDEFSSKAKDDASEYNDDDDDANTMVTTNTRPLRILIIGDSLAAGVGTSRSSTPILPETIAQALSKALDGRAVLWTCFGVPGQTSSEIVHSIQHLDDIFISTTKNHTTLLQRFNEWQMTQRQLAQSRIESAKRKTKEWIEHRKNIIDDDNGDNDSRYRDKVDTKNPLTKTNDTEKPSNRVERWWKRTRIQFQNDLQILHTIFKRDDDDDKIIMNDSNRGANHITTGGTTAASTTMSLSEQAMMIGEYDIAIVLTGLNDLKESYLPFMRSHERTKELQQLHQQQQQSSLMENHNDNEEMRAPTFNDIMKGELIRILNALLDRRMHKRTTTSSSSSVPAASNENGAHTQELSQHTNNEMNDDSNENKNKNQPHRHHNKGPLIVFPALPYQPTVLSQYPPLSWFMIPLLDMVDANKKMLSELYPGLVLFVESPDIQDWSNATLAQHGTVWEDFSVLFKLNDIAQDANERITQLMKRHYDRWIIRDGDSTCATTASTRYDSPAGNGKQINDADVDMVARLSQISPTEDDSLYELDMMGNVTIRQPQEPTPNISLGSLMVAADGIHPSDIGYDMWGRHIADAIIKEWEKVG